MPQFDHVFFLPQLVWLALVLVGLFFYLHYVAVPHFLRIRNSRRHRVSEDHAAAALWRERSERLEAERKRMLTEVMQRSAAMVLEVQEQLSEHERRVLAEQSESFEQQWVRMEARFQAAQAEATLAIEHAARDLTAVLYDRVILADQAGSLTHEIDIALKNAEVSLKQSYQVPDTLG